MSVWVKCRDVDQDAFEVSLQDVKNISQLKEAIIGKQKKLLLPDAAVLYIYSTNIGEEEAQKFKVPIPVEEQRQIGSSDDFPYFFSIAQTPAGTLCLCVVLFAMKLLSLLSCVHHSAFVFSLSCSMPIMCSGFL